jgi:hypothetical protein
LKSRRERILSYFKRRDNKTGQKQRCQACENGLFFAQNQKKRFARLFAPRKTPQTPRSGKKKAMHVSGSTLFAPQTLSALRNSNQKALQEQSPHLPVRRHYRYIM